MKIGTQLKYAGTANSPIFQTVKEPVDGTVECLCVDNGPLSINSIFLNINELEEVSEQVEPRFLV